MDTTIKDGFYVDSETKRSFYVIRGQVPPWVKSKPSDWKRLGEDKEEKMPEFNSHDFEEIYKELKINLDTLGCIMLDLSSEVVPKPPKEEILYYATVKSRKWIDGFVAGKTPHITLLYGLLESGQDWKDYVLKVLKGWNLDSISIKEVGYFDSPYKDDPYYCIVAHAEITPKLMEGRYRLELLPHINTFPGYKAHFTIAYVKKDDKIRDETVAFYSNALKGKKLKVEGLNFGYKKEEKV